MLTCSFGERDAFRSLQAGQADACAMLDLNWDAWTRDGTLDPDRYAILATRREKDSIAKMIAMHGGNTAEEMAIPLILVRGGG